MRHSFFALLLTATALGSSQAAALDVPFTEEFETGNSNWRDAGSNPLGWAASGGPDGSSYATGSFNYLGFVGPFGSGPITFRGNASAAASGGAFAGDWNTGGVTRVGAWFRHDAPVDLTLLLRITLVGFPAVAYQGSTPIAPNTWTFVQFDVGPGDPCVEEGTTCDAAKANVGNIQFGTNAPEALTTLDRAIELDIDGITIVPEPGTLVLLTSGALGLGLVARRRA
ncbi:hypothetical protein MYXO_01272 [Myxococcaceae bacterium]|jgi:hypothetical protein|nr:hypothetical protein MYXO_01272 [Myxococcaceae bacterium]